MEIITARRRNHLVCIVSDGSYMWTVRREGYTKTRLLAVINGYRKRAYKIKHDKTAATVKTKNVLKAIFPSPIVTKIMGLPFRDTNDTP